MLPVLDGRAWVGVGVYYGVEFLVELCESKEHPGYYLFATHCAGDKFLDESQRPMKAEFVQSNLDLVLKQHNLLATELSWREVPPTDLILLAERVAAGE
jgi:hypothetical protein